MNEAAFSVENKLLVENSAGQLQTRRYGIKTKMMYFHLRQAFVLYKSTLNVVKRCKVAKGSLDHFSILDPSGSSLFVSVPRCRFVKP